MVLIILVPLAIFWLYLQAHIADSGAPIRSRGSFRYERRKARKAGGPVNVKTRNAYLPAQREDGRTHVEAFHRAAEFCFIAFVIAPLFLLCGLLVWILNDLGSSTEAVGLALIMGVAVGWMFWRRQKRADR